jgi:hypothetical protein
MFEEIRINIAQGDNHSNVAWQAREREIWVGRRSTENRSLKNLVIENRSSKTAHH